MLSVFDPFRELDRLASVVFDGRPMTAYAPMDVVREKDAVRVTVDLPGVDASSIDVQVHGRVLSIRAERAALPAGNASNWLVRERATGMISRQINLGAEIDADNLIAMYDNGVLSLTVPFAAASGARKITVLTGETTELTEKSE